MHDGKNIFKERNDMAQYIKQELPDLLRTGEKKAFYRMKTQRHIDFQEFVKYICKHNAGISRGEIIQALCCTTDALAELLAEGYSVSIDELGIFKATIGLERGKEMDTLDEDAPQRNARSLCLNGVNFQADKQLVKNANLRCKLERAGVARVRRSPFSREERLQKLRTYLEEYSMIRVKDYMKLVKLSHTVAAEELCAFCRDASSGITSVGRLAGKIYVKATSSSADPF